MAVTKDDEHDLASDLRQADKIYQMIFVQHVGAIEREHDVVDQQPGTSCRRSRIRLGNSRPANPVELEFAAFVGGEIGIELHSEVCPLHLPTLQEVVDDPADQVARNAETNAVVAAAVGGDRRIDADQTAVDVDQRPAAISKIDRCVGLNEVLIDQSAVGAEMQRSPACADDPHRHRLTEPEGAADRQDQVADFQPIAVSPGHRLGRVGVDLEYGQIGLAIEPLLRRMEGASVAKANRNLLEGCRIADHVAVGDDVVAGDGRARDDHAGTGLLNETLVRRLEFALNMNDARRDLGGDARELPARLNQGRAAAIERRHIGERFVVGASMRGVTERPGRDSQTECDSQHQCRHAPPQGEPA